MRRQVLKTNILILTLGSLVLSGCATTTVEAHEARNKDKTLASLLGYDDLSDDEKYQMESRFVAIAKNALKSENYAQAAKSAYKAVQMNPDNVDALYVLAEVELNQNPDKALERYQQLNKINPIPESLQGIGLAQISMGNFKAGRARLQEAILLSTDLWRSHNGIGVSYAIEQDWGKAEQSYLKAIEIDPSQPDVYSNLGKVYLHQGKSTEALDLFEGSIKTVKSNSKYNETYRWALALNGQYDRAMHGLNEVHSAVLLNRLGQSALNQKDYEAAINFFKTAIKTHPSFYPDADQNLQFALRQMKMP